MNIKKYIYGVALGALSLTYTSCYNADKEFPDYEGGTTAYFAYQYPVRTLILGNDIYDNTLDNAHKCKIYATMGGAYNGRDAVANIVVDETLCNNLYFVDDAGQANQPVLPLPANYYKLAANTINYGGDVRGAVEVQFTDDFFNDTKALEKTYVIPLVMKSITGIDHILTGTPRAGETPSRTNESQWEVLPKDYVLYCVKYKNPWHAGYIRRGVDNVVYKDKKTTYVRKDTTLINTDPGNYDENPVNANDALCYLTSRNMTQNNFPVSFKLPTSSEASISCNLILTFNGNKITITSDDPDVTVTGEGEYIEKGTDKAEYKDFRWGNMNGQPVSRDILRLAYDVNFTKKDLKVSSADTLVTWSRQSNKREFFTVQYK